MSDPIILVRKGLDAYRRGAYREVLEAGRALVRKKPAHLVGWKLLAGGHYQLGAFDEARRAGEQAVKLAPDDPESLIALAMALGCLRQWPAAAEAVRHALSVAPENLEGALLLAKIRHNQGDLRAAVQIYLEIAKGHPQDYRAPWELANLLLQLNDQAGARAAAVQAARARPADKGVLATLMRAQLAVGEIGEANGTLDAALAVDGAVEDFHYYAGLVRIQGRRLPEALEFLRMAVNGLRNNGVRHDFGDSSKSCLTPLFGEQRERIEHLMHETLAQLAAAGVHAFATSGTLLGLVRDGRLLENDKDLDFGLPHGEQARAMAVLAHHGWRPKAGNNGLSNPREYRHVESGLALDLVGFRVEDGVILSGFWMDGVPSEWNRVLEYPEIRLVKQNAPQGEVWALADPERWLEALYGEWRIPDPDFDTVISARNQRGFSLLTQCYGFSRIYRHCREGRLGKALALTNECLRHLPEDDLLQAIRIRIMGSDTILKIPQNRV